MPNVRRICQTTDGQPSVADGDECPTGRSKHRGGPGEDFHLGHLLQGNSLVTVSEFHKPHLVKLVTTYQTLLTMVSADARPPFQAPATCQRDCKAAEEELSFCLKNNTKRAEHSEAQPGRNHPHSHFRQRSASDTTLSTLHRSESESTYRFRFSPFAILYNSIYSHCVYCIHVIVCVCVCVIDAGRLNADCRGQHLSIDDLLEMDEEEHENLVKIRLNNTEYLCVSEKHH